MCVYLQKCVTYNDKDRAHSHELPLQGEGHICMCRTTRRWTHSVLQCVAVYCSVLQCVAVCVLQCVAVCRSVLQHVAVCCCALKNNGHQN